MKKRRVVVTGAGAVTPLGNRIADIWAGTMEGRLVVGPVKSFDASQFPCKIAYEVEQFDLDDYDLQKKSLALLNRAGRFGLRAAMDAVSDSGLGRAAWQSERAAICLGVGMGCPDFDWYVRHYLPDSWCDEVLRAHPRYYPHTLTEVLAAELGARGEVATVHTACASSGQSLGEAFELVAHGEADVVLTGGADSMVNPYYFAGFCLLGALSTRNGEPQTACRPFDAGRNGFVLGEGACVLVFEEYERAKARGANILGEVCGYGVTESAYRITDLHPEGEGPIEAMTFALQDAGLAPEAVSYINAHGTSTLLNDQVEALSIRRVFGGADVHVSSTKSMTGHLISAAGAIEFLYCLLALKHQVLPPSLNVFQQDPACQVQLTPGEPAPKEMRYALSNSVGFGGSNTALIAGRI